MNDIAILNLFQTRNEDAIVQCKKKYGTLCYTVAYNILSSDQDAEECLQDALLKLWSTIPPEEPTSLQAYFITLTRNLAYDRYRYLNCDKRSHKGASLALEEIETVFQTSETPDDSLAYEELQQLINRFLATVPERDRNIFICRYYYVFPNQAIAKKTGLGEKHVHMILKRTLKKLKEFLEKENYL